MTTLWVVYDPHGLSDPRTARPSRTLTIQAFLELLTVSGGPNRTWADWEERGFRCNEWAIVPGDEVSVTVAATQWRLRQSN